MRPVYALYLAMFFDRTRWHALRAAARVLYVVLVVGAGIVGLVVGTVAALAAMAVAIFAALGVLVGLLTLMGAYRDPIHMLVDVVILVVAGLSVIIAIPMFLGIRAATRR